MPSQVTAKDRQQALRQEQECRRIENYFLTSARAVGFHMRISAVRAFMHKRPMADVLRDSMHDLRRPLAQSMLWAHVWGARRSFLAVERRPRLELSLTTTEYRKAMDFLDDRQAMTEDQLDALETDYNRAAVRVLEETQRWAESRIRDAMRDITREGLHVTEGVARLRQAFDATGLTPTGDSQLENLFRTQTHLAYGQGQARADRHPAIQDILWGYTYITTHDDRVRPNHQAMDGTTLPKEHPWWDTHWPPCGYRCRCQTLRRLKDDPQDPGPPAGIKVVEPSAKTIDGQLVQPDADPGFGARHAF